jgi:riboflavin synthase
MFSGIVEGTGKIVRLIRGADSARLTIDAGEISEGVSVSDSVSISGVCLTVVQKEGTLLSFDAIPETLHRSSLKAVNEGDYVNLERSLAVGDRIGGHFVQGHVDGTGVLRKVTPADNALILEIEVPDALLRYMVPKGSVSLDGISLTIVDVLPDAFTVWIIPHTMEITTLKYRKIGDPLNIEVDMIAKYIERLLMDRGALPADRAGSGS